MIPFLCLFFSLVVFAEDTPDAEYPYPARAVAEDELSDEQPVRKDNRGAYYYDTKKKAKQKDPYQGVQKPYRIGPDGAYYYADDEEQKEKIDSYQGVEQPIDKDARGGYYYSRKKKKKKVTTKFGEQPSRVNADGSYLYDVDPGETKNTFFFRAGMLGPPNIKASNNTTYKDVYGDSSNLVINLEYDWTLTKNLHIKAGSGITSTDGKGQFAGGGPIEPLETFQFFVFPNTVSLSYKLQIWDIQYLTPYIEGGLGYFAFIENRSDGDIFGFNGETTKYGGAFVGTATGGLLISLTKWTRGTALMSDYGATQFWIDLQYKQIFGLDQRKDFSSNMITGGFAIGF